MEVSAIKVCIQDILNGDLGDVNDLMLYRRILDYVRGNFADYEQIDYARDYFHYDILTTTNLVSSIIKLINNRVS